MLTVLSVFPDTLNLNGDAQNALVLAQRARWAGFDAGVLDLRQGEAQAPDSPDLIVIGTGPESAIPVVLAALRSIEPSLRSWSDAGVPILAVGLGWAMLAESVELDSGEVLSGLGIFSGRSVPADRVSDDIVVDSDWGRLVGYENHARSYLSASDSGLGSVVYGRGNVDGSIEGERAGSSIGTHLHGPVLAKNPSLADHLLRAALGQDYSPDNATARRVDALALAARSQVVDRLGLEAR